MLTDISYLYIYTKYAAYKNLLKMLFKRHKFVNDFMNIRPNIESKQLPEQDKCYYYIYTPLSGEYPSSGQDPLNVSTLSDLSHIIHVYANKPNNKSFKLICHGITNTWYLMYINEKCFVTSTCMHVI